MRLREFLAVAKQSMLFELDYWGRDPDRIDVASLEKALDYCAYLEEEGKSRES